jgi:phosphopantothenoylcysteine decarboxylase/phosphopantothenate--cysteine ligase
VLDALPADLYIGAAAVADFTPERMAHSKIKKVPGEDALVLRLVRTPDILADVARDARRPRMVVGFAAETDELSTYALGKLDAKRIDMIAANRVGQAGSGFESDDNALSIYWRDTNGTLGTRALGPAPKTALADALLDLVEERLTA